MQFSTQPYQTWAIERDGNIYQLSYAAQWRKLWVLRDKEMFCITSSDMEICGRGFVYREIKPLDNNLLAYFMKNGKECFEVFNENGERITFDGKVIIGTKYEAVEDYLLVYAQKGGVYFIHGANVEHVKKATLASLDEEIIAVVELDYDNRLLVHTNKGEQILEEDSIEEYQMDVYPVDTYEGPIVKIAITAKNSYVAVFTLGKAIRFQKLEKEVCDWCRLLPKHVMYEGKDGRKIFHNLCDNIETETLGPADFAIRREIKAEEAEIYFGRYVEGKRIYIYTEVYSESDNEFLLKCEAKEIKRMKMENYSGGKEYKCWKAVFPSDELRFLTTKDSLLVQNWEDVSVKDNYILVGNRAKRDSFAVYKVTDKIELVFWERLNKNEDIPRIYMGTEDVVVIKYRTQEALYWKGILVEKKESLVSTGDYQDSIYYCKWNHIVENGNCIQIPGLGEYYIEFEKRKVYLLSRNKCWWKNFFK